MFIFRPCFQPCVGESTSPSVNGISESQEENNIEVSIHQSSINGSLNTIMIKKSNYLKYFGKMDNKQLSDPQFVPSKLTLQYQVHGRQIIWKRICQIVSNCILFQGQIKPIQIYDCNPNDTYFLPTIAALARYPIRIKNIFYLTASIQSQCIYRFLVKKEGEVQQIFIDDFVPVFKDSGRPVFCQANGKQVWAMLLQKAWAKIRGSYGAIRNGCPYEVLSAFCIGPCISYDLSLINIQNRSEQLFQNLKKAYLSNYVICGTIKTQNLPNRKQNVICPITNIYSNGYIAICNYLQPSSSALQSSIIKSSLSQNSNNEQGARVFKLQEIIDNFSRIDISHENGSFNSQFETIDFDDKPVFIQFSVKDQHQAYIAIQRRTNGFIRMILAQKFDSQTFLFEDGKYQTHNSSCFIHLSIFKRGIHTLLVQTTLKERLTLRYFWKKIQQRPFNEMTVIQSKFYKQYSKDAFLQSAFQHINNNSQVKMSLIFDPIIEKEQVKRVSLLHKCGLAFLIIQVFKHSKHYFKIQIDKNQIMENGFKILGSNGDTVKVMSGSKKVFIFQLIKEQLQAEIPPKGFSLMKVI